MPPLPQNPAPARSRARRAGALAALALGLALALPGSPAAAAEPGTIAGQVFDRDSGEPVPEVMVIVLWPPPADGSPAHQEVRTTDAEGAWRVDDAPPGRYSISFVKSGYRASKMTHFEVQAGSLNRADFPIQATPPETAEGVLELEAFVVDAEVVDDIMSELELRMDSDQLLNIMSAEDFAKFASSDVADALRRVSGVSVVEGQFAIIRGLEDRYNSILYNGAPVPSPDPSRQSVQLDLFPSDVVTNLVVTKTFASDLPSNSSGGSIDIITHGYPETFEIKLSTGTGFEENAVDRFLDLTEGSPIGVEQSGLDGLETEFGGTLGGRYEVFDREIRFKGVYNREIDYRTAQGFQESREPARFIFSPIPFFPSRSGDLASGDLSLTAGRYDLTESSRTQQVTGFGAVGFDLDAEGNHRIDGSVFHTDKEERSVEFKENGYLPGLDYDAIAAQSNLSDNDFLGADFGDRGVGTLGSFIGKTIRDIGTDSSDGALWFTNFFQSESFLRRRDLTVYQVNGDHEFTSRWVPGRLKVKWAANKAKTTQQEEAYSARMFFEPDDPTPLDPAGVPYAIDELGAGLFASSPSVFFSANDVREDQDFARLNAEYEVEPFEWLGVTVGGGVWYERASRSVESQFLENPTVTAAQCARSETVICNGAGSEYAILADNLDDLGVGIFTDGLTHDAQGNLANLRESTNESKRKIDAWNFEGKVTFFDRVDLLAGVRVERLRILSLNDPFVASPDTVCPLFSPPPGCRFGLADLFPTRYLFFDRLDDRAFDEVPNIGFDPRLIQYNDEVLGISGLPMVDCQIQPTFLSLPITVQCVNFDSATLQAIVNGQIDERKILPAYGFTLRPINGLTLRGAYSRTVARPSFREIAYYVSVEPGSDDLMVGNPALTLSEVESFDARAEYTWGERGDLLAFSVFKKYIDKPIEAIVVRDPLNFESSGTALFQTYFNNPNQATLQGLEFEGRKSFDWVPAGLRLLGLETRALEFLEYLSIGGNYTYIDAEVKRSEAEIDRSATFFETLDGDVPIFTELKQTRRLFSQPKWIINADLTFDHPDWGTKMTLSYFAISDVLKAAGSASLGPDLSVRSFVLDRYTDSFDQLDFVFRQTISFERMLPSEWTLPGNWTFSMSIKNLLDGERGVVYDREQTNEKVQERSFRIGRDYSFSISYKLTF